MRGLIRKGWTVLLGAALLTCAFGAHTVHAEDLTGGNTPQQVNTDPSGQDPAAQQPADPTVQQDPAQQPADPNAQSTDPADPVQQPADPVTDPQVLLKSTPGGQNPDPVTNPAPATKPDPNKQDPTQTTDPTNPAQTTDPTNPAQTTDPTNPTQTTDPADPAQQDPQPVPDEIITAEVYVRLGGKLPDVILTNADSAYYTGMLFTVQINLSELERRLSEDGLPVKYVDDQNGIYYSHDASGLSGPYEFWNEYVLPCVDAAQQSFFTKEGMQAYPAAEEGEFVGYVLKREKDGNHHYHLDGIIEAEVGGLQTPPASNPKPVTAENYPELMITTNVWNAARNNSSPSHANLAVRGEVFTYELKTTLPDADTAAWVNRFVIEDTLVEELCFAGAATVLVNGQQVALPAQAVEQSGQSLVVDLPKEFLASNAGKEICVSFGVKIRDGVSLTKYANAGNSGRIEVPNACSYHVWLYEEESGPRRLPSERDPDVSEFSGVATVTPPATDIRLEETVNGRRTDGGAVMLGSRYEEVTYTIRAYVLERADMRSLSISNTIAGVMEFRGGVEVMIGGILTDGLVQIFDKTLVVSVPEKYLTDEALKQPITVSFRAAIISGSDLTAYIDAAANGVRIPNNTVVQTATGAAPLPSNTVQIATGDPEIEVAVNSTQSTVLKDSTETFTYEIKTRVPERARISRFVITDDLPDAMQFEGDVSVTVGGYTIPGKAVINGRRLAVTIDGDLLKNNMGKAVIIRFGAKLKEGADASQGVANTAAYQIDNETPRQFRGQATVYAEKAAVTEEAEETEETEETLQAEAAGVLGMRRSGQGQNVLNARDAQTGDPVSDLHARETVMGMALMGLFSLLCLNTPKKEEEA